MVIPRTESLRLAFVVAIAALPAACSEATLSAPAPAVTISSVAFPTGIVGTPYSASLAASGGDGGFEWSLVSGSLPEGLALSAAGSVSGTPTTAGSFDAMVRVTSGGQSATGPVRVAVVEPVSIATQDVPAAIVGTPYDQTLTATGGIGDFSWTVTSGQFPDGLDMSEDGAITGTPTAVEASDITVEVTSGEQSTTATYHISVEEPLSITTTSLPSGSVGSAYEQTIEATGGSGVFAFSISDGGLPVGLALDDDGAITGTPTVAGTSEVTVEATSGTQTASVDLSVIVFASLSITTTSLGGGTVGVAYSDSLTAVGGTGTYTFSVVAGSLPDGLSVDGDGVISGTPTSAGTSDATVQVTSADQTATADVEITIGAAVSITTTTLPDGVTESAYAEGLGAEGGDGTFAWTLDAGALPGGLALSGSGALTGAPTVAGSFDFTVRVTSAGSSATKALTLTVRSPVVVTTTSLPNGAVGDAYDQTIAASGGSGTYLFTLSEGALPTGTSIDASTGRITGTPSAAGTFDFTVQATSDALSDAQALSITVVAAGCTLSSLPDTDGDRLPDCVETNTNLYVSPTNTGTNPTDADSDDDGIPDGDEVLGTTDGLDLPAMGLDPLRKNVLLEYDWFADSEDGDAHDHRPSSASIAMVAAAFANAPVSNPDGTTGITAIQDYGQGGVFTGGSQVSDVDGCLVGGVGGSEYASRLAANFATNRVGYFHYSLMIHQYNADGADSCAGASGSSGQAFYNDHRLIVSSNWWHNGSSNGDQWVANTIVHELGHNLNLSHGGSRSGPQSDFNHKPNYPSVMNYRYQFPGVDTNCDVIADGVLDYSRGTRITLDESALDETQGVCGATAVDWNADGDTTDTALSLDAQEWDQGAGSGEGNGSAVDTLEDFDDWGNLTLATSVAGATSPLAGFVLEVAEICTSAPPRPGSR